MSPAALLPLLPQFEAFLLESKAASTAQVYRTMVRAVLNFAVEQKQPRITADFWRDFVQNDSSSSQYQKMRRAAWRAFVAWLALLADRPAGDFPFAPALGKAGRPVTLATQRDVLLHALFLHVSSAAALPRLRWGNVKRCLEFAELRIDAGRDTQFTIRVSLAWLDAVRAANYPYSDPTPSAPLFPAEVEGNEPIAPWQIPLVAERVVDAVHQRKVKPWTVPPNLHNLAL